MGGYIQGTTVKKTGTVQWELPDDNGTLHTITIPNTLYAPQTSVRILSPQHWGQEQIKDNRGMVICSTDHKNTVVTWDEGKHSKHLPLNGSNVSIWETYPSANGYKAFRNVFDIEYANGDEVEIGEEEHGSGYCVEENMDCKSDKCLSYKSLTLSVKELDATHRRKQLEFLRWNHRLNHINFNTLKIMSEKGLIPKHLKNLETPLCSACIYAMKTKTPWRHRNKHYRAIGKDKVHNPGDFVSIDHLERKLP